MHQPPAFFCDEMLTRLGRWLRAAGYDTRIQAGGASDRSMIQTAVMEGRCVLSRDRKLLEFREAAGTVIWLRGNTVSDCVDELAQYVAVDWLYRPFTRCMVCNTLLVPADPARQGELPPITHALVDKLYSCPGCGKLYWEGGHVRRMRHRLNAWRTQYGHTQDPSFK